MYTSDLRFSLLYSVINETRFIFSDVGLSYDVKRQGEVVMHSKVRDARPRR